MKRVLKLYPTFEQAHTAFREFQEPDGIYYNSNWRVVAEGGQKSTEFSTIPTRHSVERFLGREFDEVHVFGACSAEVLRFLQTALRTRLIQHNQPA